MRTSFPGVRPSFFTEDAAPRAIWSFAAQITVVLGLENATGARSLLQNARRKLRRALGDKDNPFIEEDL